MLSVKNRDHIYYTPHNLGNFDLIFILKAMKDANKEKGYEHYIINSILRDSKVLKCVKEPRSAKTSSIYRAVRSVKNNLYRFIKFITR